MASSPSSAGATPRSTLAGLAGLRPIETSHFYTEDLVIDRWRKTRGFGFVLRSQSDVDTHIPFPQTDFPKHEIKRGHAVPKAAFTRFLHDGIPPKDTVLVRWLSSPEPELISTSRLLVADRELLAGDVVKENAQSSISGTVISSRVRCAVHHNSQRGWEEHIANGGHGEFRSKVGGLLHDIPGEELQPAQQFPDGSLIVYHDWIGRVEPLEEEVTIRLANGSVVIVGDSGDLEGQHIGSLLEVGDIVTTKKWNLRRGRWVFGSYMPNVEPQGQIVEIRPTLIGVRWLFRDPRCSMPQPPEELDVDVLTSGEIQIYDRTRAPTGTPGVESPVSAPDFKVGDYARFKDITGAAVKYDGKSVGLNGVPHGLLCRRPRTETLGYDINTFQILATHTEVTVRWQDMTTSTHDAATLVPDLNLDSDEEVWPGEIVCTTEAKTGEVPHWAFEPAKVGVVQSVRSSDRMAQVRWWPDAFVRYYKEAILDDDFANSDPSGGLCSDTTLGKLSPEVESISLYDVKLAKGLGKRRADFVFIRPEAVVVDESDDTDGKPLNWFGEVVDLGLDGFITVRLSGLAVVRDVRVSPENLVMVYSTDWDDDLDDGWGDGDGGAPDFSDESDRMSYEMERGSLPAVIDRLLNFNDAVDEDSMPFLPYDVDEDADGADGDDDDENWSTESDESDETDILENFDYDINGTPMTEEATSANNSPSTQPNSAKANPTAKSTTDRPPPEPLNLKDRPDAPPSFTILDSAPPVSHHYLNALQPQSRSLLRRISKEHKILGSSLPEGVFVRTWESRLDLLRILFVGPVDTPYALAPFVMDIQMDSDYPSSPPNVYFHSWTKGSNPVNPNLYTDGKVCLSLLGTWHTGEKTENWDPENSTVLQVLVSILGLVLVKEPYYNEAGYEVRIGSEETKLASMHYSERSNFLSRGFITHALTNPVEGCEDVVSWLYTSQADGAPRLLQRAVEEAKGVISRSKGTEIDPSARDGIYVISTGAVVKLAQQLRDMELCLAGD